MDWLFPAIRLVLFLTGIALTIYALKFRTEKHPTIPSFKMRSWVPIWKMKECFTPKGYRLHLIGWGMVYTALLFFVW